MQTPQSAHRRTAAARVEAPARSRLLPSTLAQAHPISPLTPRLVTTAEHGSRAWSSGPAQRSPGGYTQRGLLLLPDVTKGSNKGGPLADLTDGPMTSAVVEPEGKEPAGMQLDEHVWTTSDHIYGRYLRSHLSGGRTVPICLELTVGHGGLDSEKEGSKSGYIIGRKASETWAVEWWR